jgi:hypothetical protein
MRTKTLALTAFALAALGSLVLPAAAQAADVTITFNVKNGQDGPPLSGISFFARWVDDDGITHFDWDQTDANGQVKLTVPSGPNVLVIINQENKDFLSSWTSEVAYEASQTIDVELLYEL